MKFYNNLQKFDYLKSLFYTACMISDFPEWTGDPVFDDRSHGGRLPVPCHHR